MPSKKLKQVTELKPHADGRRNNKTVVIWDELDANIRFFVTDLDVDHLDGCYVNGVLTPDQYNDQICALVYDKDLGTKIVAMGTDFPVSEVRNGAGVVRMGFLP